VVAARVHEADIEFLRGIAERDPDERCRAAARSALRDLTAAPEPDQEEMSSPAASALAREVRRNFLDPEFPPTLTPLAKLSTTDAENLLTVLVDALFLRNTRPAARRDVRRGTERLTRVVGVVTRGGTRAVTTRLTDLELVAAADDENWAEGLLSLVRPQDILVAAWWATAVEDDRLGALRGLADAARAGLGEPRVVLPDADDGPRPLLTLLNLAHPRRLPDRGTPWDDGWVSTGVPVGVDVVAAPATAYPLLDAPEQVVPGGDFELRVGLSATEDLSVNSDGPFDLPARAFTLTITLVHGGFTLLGGASSTITLEATEDDALPYTVVRMRADDDPSRPADRTVMAFYHADGQVLGHAARVIRVSRDAPPAARMVWAGPVARWDFDPEAPRADLELFVVRDNDRADERWAWLIRSPHPEVPDTTSAIPVRLDPAAAGSIKEFTRGVEARVEQVDLPEYLEGFARGIGDLVPEEVWDALRAVRQKAGRPPTVLLATEDPHIPWELARVRESWTRGRSWLGAQAVVGRWPLPPTGACPAPPARVAADRMAVVSGAYPQGYSLPDAEAEGRALCARFGATAVPATLAGLLDVLHGRVETDVLHVALHGRFDTTGTNDGILMIDATTYLSPTTVRGVGASRIRLVFLNACQVGQGRELLGAYSGMAAAFVGIGIGGLIAPLWKVNDTVASRLADSFYTSVFDGTTSPAAFLREVRDAADGSESTPLAYVFFGHPMLALDRKGRDDNA